MPQVLLHTLQEDQIPTFVSCVVLHDRFSIVLVALHKTPLFRVVQFLTRSWKPIPQDMLHGLQLDHLQEVSQTRVTERLPEHGMLLR